MNANTRLKVRTVLATALASSTLLLTACSGLSERDQAILDECQYLVSSEVDGAYTNEMARTTKALVESLGKEYREGPLTKGKFTDLQFAELKFEEDYISGSFTAGVDTNPETKYVGGKYSCFVDGNDVEISEIAYPE